MTVSYKLEGGLTAISVGGYSQFDSPFVHFKDELNALLHSDVVEETSPLFGVLWGVEITYPILRVGPPSRGQNVMVLQ